MLSMLTKKHNVVSARRCRGLKSLLFLPIISTLLICHDLTVVVDGYNIPRPFLPTTKIATDAFISFIPQPSLLLSDGDDPISTTVESAAKQVISSPPLDIITSDAGGILSSAGDIIKNILLGVTAVIFLGAGLTYLTASIVIPAAARELEKECLELAPELWEEYQAKLEPGQTMAQRPELMQELGAKVQPLIDEKVRRMDMAINSGGGGRGGQQPYDGAPSSANRVVDGPTLTTTNRWDDDVVDVDVVKDDNKDKKRSVE